MTLNKALIPSAIREDAEKAVTVLKRHGCKEVYLFELPETETRNALPDMELGIRGLPPELFFHAYGELCLSVASRVRLLDLGKHGRYYRFISGEGGTLRIG